MEPDGMPDGPTGFNVKDSRWNWRTVYADNEANYPFPFLPTLRNTVHQRQCHGA